MNESEGKIAILMVLNDEEEEVEWSWLWINATKSEFDALGWVVRKALLYKNYRLFKVYVKK